MLIGDPKQVLSQPMYVLVSDEIAERIGGNVMGKRFEIDDAPGQALTIGGVFKKLPDNTEQSYDIIVSLSSILYFNFFIIFVVFATVLFYTAALPRIFV